MNNLCHDTNPLTVLFLLPLDLRNFMKMRLNFNMYFLILCKFLMNKFERKIIIFFGFRKLVCLTDSPFKVLYSILLFLSIFTASTNWNCDWSAFVVLGSNLISPSNPHNGHFFKGSEIIVDFMTIFMSTNKSRPTMLLSNFYFFHWMNKIYTK
jgi:hypothetical protein